MKKKIIFIQCSIMIMVIAVFTTCSSSGTPVAVILASKDKVKEKVAAVTVKPVTVVLAFEDIHFDHNKSTLKPKARAILKRNIQILQDNPNAKVRIAGYTSASGTDQYNMKLSEKRAIAVKNFLVRNGVTSPDRLTVIGFGKKNPFIHEMAPKKIYSPAAKANMRVLFEIVVE